MKGILSQTELDELANAIADAERTTSGEIRLMIVGRSCFSGGVYRLWWLSLSCAGLLALWFQQHLLYAEPWWLMPAVLVLAALIAWPLARVPVLQRVMLHPRDVDRAVWARAEVEFYREGLSATKGATGILLFLSLFERKAVVLADKAIAERLPPSTWDDVVAIILQGGRSGRWKAELESAIRLCGRLLAENFPIQPDDVNELANTVIVKE